MLVVPVWWWETDGHLGGTRLVWGYPGLLPERPRQTTFNNQLHGAFQSGFYANHSAPTAVLEVINDVQYE